MERPTARLRLDPAPAKAVAKAVGILSEWLPVEHLRLGGGTALEARWHHRSSTDLDFFYSPGTNRPSALFLKDFDDIRMDLHRLVRDNRLGINRIATQRDAYDFAVARTLAPDDLAYAWSAMTEDMKETAVATYREFAEGEAEPRSRALQRPGYVGIASDLWKHVLRMVETELEYVPPLAQGDTEQEPGP